MSLTCVTCGCGGGPWGYGNGCCQTCQPANTIHRGECPDPGTLVNPPYIAALDYKFCRGRLETQAGLLVSQLNGSGNASITFTTTPRVQLDDVNAAEDTAFGQLIVMGSDYRWRALQAPAVAGLVMQTNGSGDLILTAPPAATVPDPLAINNLNVAVAATVQNLTTNGTVTLNNIAAGTVASLIGLNASNQVVTQSLASSLAFTMFYEAPTSPSATAPNKTAANGSYLIIGNRLYDSGSNIISVTTSQSVTVQTAGKYLIGWVGLCRVLANGRAAISLVVNGVVVNNGNGRTDAEVGLINSALLVPLTGLECRDLAANDVLQLQLSSAGTVNTYQARLVAVKLADA